VTFSATQSVRAGVVCIAMTAAIASAALAFAHGSGGDGGGVGTFGGAGDSAQLQISGSIPGTCTFTTLPTGTSLGTLASGAVTELGTLGFTCNLATVASVNLTVKSANGALLRDGGSESVAYSVAWNIQGASDAYNATAPWTSALAFTLSSGPNGVEQIGVYRVKVTGTTAGLPAGNYKDTITYTIAP